MGKLKSEQRVSRVESSRVEANAGGWRRRNPVRAVNRLAALQNENECLGYDMSPEKEGLVPRDFGFDAVQNCETVSIPSDV